MNDAMPEPSAAAVEADVRRALEEDIGSGDATADLLPQHEQAHARVLCREAATVCGRPWFDRCFSLLDADVHIDWHVREGESVAADTVLCDIRGSTRSLLGAERCALNFLQTLSATATRTARYVAAIAGTDCTLLDTRKTLPGLRQAQKYAVRCGGGSNHRMGLFDALLIKENHIAAAGGLDLAVAAARRNHPDLMLEVEVETLAELDQAMAAGADRIMLDGFSPEQTRAAIARVAGRVPLEVSGNMTLEHISEYARLGVDYISVGALTKHIRAVDLSLRLVADST